MNRVVNWRLIPALLAMILLAVGLASLLTRTASADPVSDVPGSVQAEDYNPADVSDDDAGNFGNAVEYTDDVDVWSTVGEEGLTVGRTRDGEYTTYDLNVTESGIYEFAARVATGNVAGGALTLEVDGTVIGTEAIADTGGWWTWIAVPIGDITLTPGAHTLKASWTTGNVNFDRIDVTRIGDVAAPVSEVPGQIQAEDYNPADISDDDAGNFGNAAEYTDDVDVWSTVGEEGLTVGRTRDGEYTTYELNVTEAGTYNLAARVATGNIAGGALTLEVDGTTIGTETIANTGGWWTWIAVPIGDITLTPGAHTLTATWTTGNVNFDRIDATLATVPLTVTPVPPTATATATPTPTPNGPVLDLPGRVQAEDYNDVFSDTDTGNLGSAAQYTDDVDVFTSVGEVGFTVGRLRAGEFTTYNLNVTETETYAFSIRAATGDAVGGDVTFDIDGTTVGTVAIGNTGGWWTFDNFAIGQLPLTAGAHTLTATWATGNVNFDRLDVDIFGRPPTPTPTPAPLSCPDIAVVQEAEDGRLVGDMLAVSSSNAGNGQYVAVPAAVAGSFDEPGSSWVEVCVTVETAGEYYVDARTQAVNPSNDSVWLTINDDAPISWAVPESDPLNTWSWNQVSGINADDEPIRFNFTAGEHVLRFSHRESDTKLDRFRLSAYVPPPPLPDPTCRDASATQEAEAAPFGGEFTAVADPTARGGEYLVVPDESGNSNLVPSDVSASRFCVTITNPGRYAIEGRTKAPTVNDNSLWFTLDEGTPIDWGLPLSDSWTWNRVSGLEDSSPIIFDLAAGDHDVRVALREDGTQLDSLRFVLLDAVCSTDLSVEAENGGLNGTFVALNDGSASGGKYAVNNLGDAAFPNPNYVEFCFTTTEAGRYLLEARTQAVGESNSFYVTFANDAEIAWGASADAGWIDGSVRPFGADEAEQWLLAPGDHVVRFYLRESGTRLDNVTLVRTDEVEVNPGDDLKALIDFGRDGDTFLFNDGVYNEDKLVPKNGMTFKAINQRNAIFDGGGVESVLFNGTASDVTIEGFEIRNYNPGVYVAPISARVVTDGPDKFADGNDWVIRNNFIHDNDSAGINLGSGMIVEDNLISRNSHIGISGIADQGFELTGVKIRDNEINENTAANPSFPFEFHEGGIKATYAIDMEVTGNNIHDNRGAGVYCDLFCETLLVDNNTITDNGGRQNAGGVKVEIGDGAIITNNIIDGVNGFVEGQPLWGGVTISESQNILVEDNDIRMDGAVGIMFRNGTTIQDNAGNLSRDPLLNVRFINNTITAVDGETRVGFAGGTAIDPGAVVLTGNDYIHGTDGVNSGTIRFTYSGAKTWAYWQTTLGYDATGTYTP